MIEISRLSLRHLWNVLCRALPRGTSCQHQPLTLRADGKKLVAIMTTEDVTVSFHEESKNSDAMTLPLEAIKQLQGSRTFDMVRFEAAEPGTITAHWEDGDIPQVSSIATVEKFTHMQEPVLATDWRANPKLLQTLVESQAATNKHHDRYATNCLQLQGKAGAIVATDGHQLLLRQGFDFPWTESVLVPCSPIFAAKEVTTDDAVEIGKTNDHVILRTGHWTVFLKIDKNGHFPDTRKVLEKTEGNATRLLIAPEDAEFLSRTIPRLPGHDDEAPSITLDLNGHVCLRSKGSQSPKATELILSRSAYTGKVVRICFPPRMLARALEMGFTDLSVGEPTEPVCCRHEGNSYVFGLQPVEMQLASTQDAIRIDSTGGAVAPHPEPKPERKPMTVNEIPAIEAPPAAKFVRNRPKNTETAGVMAEAVSLRDQLHESYRSACALIRSLKQQRRQSKLMQTTLQSLKQLQTIDA